MNRRFRALGKLAGQSQKFSSEIEGVIGSITNCIKEIVRKVIKNLILKNNNSYLQIKITIV